MKKNPHYFRIAVVIIALLSIPSVAAVPFIDFDPYPGAAMFCGINVALYLIIFWMINNQRINVERFIQKFGENAPKKVVNAIKIEIFFKGIGIFAISMLNLIVSGFFYHSWTEYEVTAEPLAFLFVAMNFIVIFVLFLLFIIQIFYFPFQFVRDSAQMLIDEVKNGK